jgi:hypothetical protein
MKVTPMHIPSIEDDLAGVAWHEAAHVIVARHFGLTAWADLVFQGMPTIESRAYTGQTKHLRTTPFRRACIGWAGELAEALLRAETTREPRDEVLDMVFDCSNDLAESSATDQDAVGGHGQKWRACKTAHGILIRRYEQLRAEALSLIEHAPRPDKALAVV